MSATALKCLVCSTCVALAGCPSDSWSPWTDDPPDSCAGFEDFRAGEWMPVLLETAQSFTNEAGEARTLQVTDVETDRSYFSSQPYCRRSSTLTLTGLGSRIWTIWQFTNIEDPRGQSVFDQRLTLTVTTSVVGQVGPPASPVYDLTLQDLTVPANSGVNPDSGVAHAYDPTRTINGVSYSDVLEASIPRDGRYGPLALPEADWVRIVIARGVGLVQYELRNGQMFTRQ